VCGIEAVLNLLVFIRNNFFHFFQWQFHYFGDPKLLCLLRVITNKNFLKDCVHLIKPSYIPIDILRKTLKPFSEHNICIMLRFPKHQVIKVFFSLVESFAKVFIEKRCCIHLKTMKVLECINIFICFQIWVLNKRTRSFNQIVFPFSLSVVVIRVKWKVHKSRDNSSSI